MGRSDNDLRLGRRILKSLLRVLLVLAFAYVGITAVFFYYYTDILYQPSRQVIFTPEKVGIDSYEDVWLVSGGAFRINGWFVPTTSNLKNGYTLLVFHGNAGNLSSALQRIMLYRTLGLDVFAIDYRGFGTSEGEPSEKALYEDAAAAWSYLTDQRKVPPNKIVILGYSLGGGVASWLAEKHPEAAGLILESTFTSLDDVAADLFPLLPARLVVGGQFDTLGRIGRMRIPLLSIHGRGDPLVDFANGEKIFAAYTGEKTFLEIDSDHNSGFMISRKAYEAAIKRFINSLEAVPEPLQSKPMP